MCTVVPYEYMSVSDVLNGLIYLTLSSPTRVDAVWRALRPFKEGWNFLLDPLAPRAPRCAHDVISTMWHTWQLAPAAAQSGTAMCS